MPSASEPSRRDFLTGAGGAERPDPGDSQPVSQPRGGTTVRLTTRAMACEFAAILNPDCPDHVDAASNALDLVHTCEDLMTVYREDSDLSAVNACAASGATQVPAELFDAIVAACELSKASGGTFDPTSGPLIELWRQARADNRVPAQAEIAARLEIVGAEHVLIDADQGAIRFDRPGIQLNLGGIGKGIALDRAAHDLDAENVDAYLLHGGRSSILARGNHNDQGGWPVGIGNPLFTNQRLATVLLADEAFATSGSNIQYFRHGGRRYGHILDPRTGWPAEGLLSVSVFAPTAAEADALSTAFFVGGVENARTYCDNRPEVSAILIPFPTSGRRVAPVLVNVSPERLYWNDDQVVLS